jgi:pyrroline-5-carboxylate reductase
MKLNQKVGFLGAGRMATALVRGLLDAGLCAKEHLLASDVDTARREHFEKETGVKTCARNEEVATFCDMAILAVKPVHVREALASIRDPFGRKLLISIAAGVPIRTLEGGLEKGARVVRVMPNTPALARAGASVFAAGANVGKEDLHHTEAILGAVGVAIPLPEEMLDAVTGLSGSGPAYIFLIIEALSDGGVEMGLPRDVATQLAIQTVLGSAKLVLETKRHPRELRDMVTSPGGTTIEGLKVLEETGVHAALKKAVRAATEKSRKLGQAH